MDKINYNVLGVMSGTSLDGIDIALVNFRKTKQWEYRIAVAETFSYSREWQEKLGRAIGFSDEDLQQLNDDYTGYLVSAISAFIEEHKIKDLDAVCSHGHTIKHEPQNGFTLQIGNQVKLAELLQQTVVCDFRVQDVQLGGQGAPLVPIGDELLFSDYEYCLNLGGFANISTRLNDRRVAFDICAVNTVLNYLAGKKGFPYDKGGEMADSGKLDQELLDKLNALHFYLQKPPKSLGIEWVNEQIFPLLSEKRDIPSALHTYAVHAAIQISAVLDQKKQSKVLVTGGGAFNNFLMEEIKNRTQNEIIIPSPEVVNFKEALIFGFLGVLKIRGEVNVLSSVTGSEKDHSSGRIYRPQN